MTDLRSSDDRGSGQAITDGGHGAPASPAKGIALVVLAIALGALLIAKGPRWDSAATDSATPGSGNSRIGLTSTTVPGGSTTPPAPSTSVPAATLSCVAANGANIKGLAGKVADALKAKGYVKCTAVTASSDQPATAVYFQPGFQGDAQVIATALGLNSASVVKSMPPSPPVPADTVANVLVVIGADTGQSMAATGTVGAAGTVTTTTAAAGAGTTTTTSG